MVGSAVDEARPFLNLLVLARPKASPFEARDHVAQIASVRDRQSSIATFVPKDRAVSATEIRIMLKQLEHVAALPTIRLGTRSILLTTIRRGRLG